MRHKSPFHVDIRLFSVYAGVFLVFSGAINTLIVSKLGGLASIFLGFLFFFGAAFLSTLQYAEKNKKLMQAAMWLIVFVVIYVFGLELFYTSDRYVSIFGYSATLETYNILKSFPLWLLGVVIATNIEQRNVERVFILICVLLVWGMIATLLALKSYPDYIRYRTTGHDVGNYALKGAMGYELTYTIPIIAFSVSMVLKEKNVILAYTFFALCIIYVANCSLLLAITALILNCVLSFSMSIRQPLLRGLAVIAIIVVACWAIVNFQEIGGMLINISEEINDINIKMRLEQIGRLLKYGDDEGASLNRLDLYMSSIRGFKESPIIGMVPINSNYEISGHSTLLDILSALGIVGGIPFIAFWVSIIRYLNAEITNPRMARITRIGVVTFVFITIFNPVFANVHIMFATICILPLCAQLSKET